MYRETGEPLNSYTDGRSAYDALEPLRTFEEPPRKCGIRRTDAG